MPKNARPGRARHEGTPGAEEPDTPPAAPRVDSADGTECSDLLSGEVPDRIASCVAAYTSRRLSEEKNEIVDRLMHVFELWLDAQLTRLEESFDEGEGSAGPGGSVDSFRGIGSSGKRTGKKRGLDREDKEGKESPGGSGDGDGGGKSRLGANKRTKVAHHKLACPYYKRDPEKFRNHKTCIGPGPGWDNFSRAKEHVTRNHAMRLLCIRCQDPFHSEEARRRHLREEVQCPVRDEAGARDPTEGFDELQLKQLRGRRPANMSEADKWRDMYRILFNIEDETEKLPSPYHDQDEIFYSRVQRASAVIREELPPQIRRVLEDEITLEMRGAEHRIVSRLVEVVYNLFQGISRPSASASAPAPTSSSPVAADTQASSSSQLDTPRPATPTTIEQTMDFNSAMCMLLASGIDPSIDFSEGGMYGWDDGWGSDVLSSDSSYRGSEATSVGGSMVGSLDTPVLSSRHSSPASGEFPGKGGS